MRTFMGYISHGSGEVVLSRNKESRESWEYSLVSPVMIQYLVAVLMQNKRTIRETRRHSNGLLYHRQTLSGD